LITSRVIQLSFCIIAIQASSDESSDNVAETEPKIGRVSQFFAGDTIKRLQVEKTELKEENKDLIQELDEKNLLIDDLEDQIETLTKEKSDGKGIPQELTKRQELAKRLSSMPETSRATLDEVLTTAKALEEETVSRVDGNQRLYEEKWAKDHAEKMKKIREESKEYKIQRAKKLAENRATEIKIEEIRQAALERSRMMEKQDRADKQRYEEDRVRRRAGFKERARKSFVYQCQMYGKESALKTMKTKTYDSDDDFTYDEAVEEANKLE